MAYKRFSTEKADYCLAYNIHQRVQDDDIFKGEKIKDLDALVLELGNHASLPSNNLHDSKWPYPYISIEEQITQYNPDLPVYFVDAFAKRTIIKRAEMMALPLVTYAASLVFGNNEILRYGMLVWGSQFFGQMLCSVNASFGETRICPNIVSLLGLLPPTEILELRNAISAKKIEEWLVPSFDYRPNIAIVYGAGHAGIEWCLKSKRRRDGVINFYRKLKFPAMEKTTLDCITKANYNSATNCWNLERFNSGTIKT